MDSFTKMCPFCHYEARTDLLRRHIKAVHSYDSVINKKNPLSQNYFFQLPGTEKKILISYKGGKEEMPETVSAFNLFVCFECYTWNKTGYAPSRERYFDYCNSHVCKVRQARAKRTGKPRVAVTSSVDPFEATLALILDRSDFNRYADVIKLFYTPADDDEPATTGHQYLLDMHKYFKDVHKEFTDVQKKAQQEFKEEREYFIGELDARDSEISCLRTELREQTELTQKANRYLCLKTEESRQEIERLTALLKHHNITI